MNYKLKALFIILLGLILIIIAIVMIIRQPNIKVKENRELNSEEMVSLLKYATYDLTRSETLEEGSITDDSMVLFAASYMQINSEYQYYLTFDSEQNMVKVKKEKVEEVVYYIFNRTVNYSNISYKIEDDYIHIVLPYSGGDMQVYKYKSEEYDKSTDTYKVYIDVLETGANRLKKLTDPSIVDYETKDVLFTMIFKYKIVDGRKVLLAFNSINNY